MATLTINGRKVTVDDSFRNLSPEQQEATVEEIAAQLGASGEQAGESQQSQDARAAMSEASNSLTGTIDNIDKTRYDALPEWQKPLVAAQDTAALLGDGLTMGFGDKAVAAVRAPFTDKTYEQELAGARDLTQGARNRAQGAGTLAEITGAVAAPMAAVSRGATIAGRFGTSAMTGAKGVAARAGLMAGEGAAYGAASAAGHDTDLGEGAITGAIGGAGGSVLGDTISAGLSKAHKAIKGKPNVPDLAVLKTQAKEAYEQADKAGVIFKPEGIQRLSGDIKSELADFGYLPDLQPRVAAALKEVDRLSEGNVTLKGVDLLRRVADNVRASKEPSEKAIGNMIISKVDEFIENARPSEIMSGNAMEGAAALKKARGLWSRVSKNQRFLNAIEEARDNAGTAGSGSNIENNTRQSIKRLQRDRGFTPDERAAMRQIVRGTPGQNALRLAGKFAPTGVVSGVLSGGAGYGLAGPLGAALPLAGAGAKALADRGSRQGVGALETLIRSGGDAAALEAAQGTLARLTQPQREAIARFVLGSAVTVGNQPGQ